MKKKLLSIVMVIAMLACMIPASSLQVFSAQQVGASGVTPVNMSVYVSPGATIDFGVLLSSKTNQMTIDKSTSKGITISTSTNSNTKNYDFEVSVSENATVGDKDTFVASAKGSTYANITVTVISALDISSEAFEKVFNANNCEYSVSPTAAGIKQSYTSKTLKIEADTTKQDGFSATCTVIPYSGSPATSGTAKYYNATTAPDGIYAYKVSVGHKKGKTYLHNATAHWFACGNANCSLNGNDDAETVANYEEAFDDSATGSALKTLLAYEDHDFETSTTYVKNADGSYSKKCACGGVAASTDDENTITTTDYHIEKGECQSNNGVGYMMGHQDHADGNGKGRAIIPLTEEQFAEITGDTITVIGGDKGKQTELGIYYAYKYFYDDGEKIEAGKTAGLEDYVAFIIIDCDKDENDISGYGYYRIYDGEAIESNFIFDTLYVNK